MPTIPNLIIAGAPKCGTTSLFQYLADHPEVCPSIEKEASFLVDTDYPLFRKDRSVLTQGLQGYSYFFPDYVPETHKIVMEATPHYLYQDTALEAISKMKETPELIFVLRNPSRRIYSLFRFAQHNIGALDPKMTFAQFIERVDRQSFPKERVVVRSAIDHSCYDKYLARWYDTVDSSKIHVYVFEDMISEPRSFMENLAKTLRIDSQFYEAYGFKAENKTTMSRSSALRRLERRFRASRLKPEWLGPLRSTVKDSYKKIQGGSPIAPPSEGEKLILKELDQRFVESKKALSRLAGLDLSAWG